MDNHPIPQDITGFQFKLIGAMTVKQFLYLAVGTILAWFFFFVLPLPSLIRWPIALFAIGLGGSIAFIPIDGRPMDQMFTNLIKAIYAPTQYVYDKTEGTGVATLTIQTPQPAPIQPQIQNVAIAQPPQTQTPIAQSQIATSIPISTPQPISPQQQPIPNPPQPTINGASLGWQIDDDEKDKKKYIDENNSLVKNEIKLESEVVELKKEIDEAKAEEKLSLGSTDSTQIHQKTDELSKMLEQTIAQKEELEKELAMLKSDLPNAQKEQTFTPSTATPPPTTQNVKQVPKGLEKSSGVIATPQDPNLITGIVKDPRGNPLQNILIEVKDTEDNPVRAFKTNALGQFASATSLSNGKYVITFEDTKGQHRFDTIEIDVNGGIIMPLEIFSIDQREELRRELFN